MTFQRIWKLSDINLLIVFANCKFIDCVPFSCILSIRLIIKPNTFKKILLSNFQKTGSNLYLHKMDLKNQSSSSTNLSVCLPICDTSFSRSTKSVFFSFWHFAIYTKKKLSWILENCICCLDNWVNKINLDQKQNICHYNEGDLIF